MNEVNREQGFQALANAVVEQAAKDYFKTIKSIEKDMDRFEKNVAEAGEKDHAWIGIPVTGKEKSSFDIFLQKAEARRITLLKVMDDCERFFKSEWIAMLTELYGRVLMEKIRKESGYDSERILEFRREARKKDKNQTYGNRRAEDNDGEGDSGVI